MSQLGAGSGTSGYLRSLVPRLPTPVWLLLTGGAVSSLGTGFVLPYGTIYLHLVRGLAIPVVGAVLSASALAGLLTGILGGSLVDRAGPRRVVLLGLLVQALGFGYLGYSINLPEALVAMVVIGIGTGLFYPSLAALLAAITDRAQRAAAAPLQYASTNLGIGLGAVAGGFIVSTSRPASFTLVYLVNAVSFVVMAILVALFAPSGRSAPEQVGPARGSYRLVLRDLRFMAVVAFNALVVVATYSQLDAAVPLYARTFLGVPTAAIGLLLAANTAFIVVAQLPIGRAVRRLTRSRTMAASAAVWGLAWLMGEVASLQHGLAAAAWLGLFAVIFGAGECLLSSAIGPLVADLAPASVRGRYMATFTFSWSVGLLVGPGVGGLLVGSFLRPSMWFIWAAVCLGLVFAAQAMGRRLLGPANHPPPAAS